MTKKKKIARKYTRKQLEEIKTADDAESRRSLIEDLINRAAIGDPMSLAEKDHAYRFIRASFSADTGERLDINEFPTLEEYDFKELYRHYHSDLEGKYGIEDAFGLIPIEQKKEDVKRLNNANLQWEAVVAKKNHTEDLLNRVATEARSELKEIDRLSADGNLDFREVSEKKKSIILHSKYLYLTVKEFFDELSGDSVIVKYNGGEIEINAESLTHIMFRHYAGASKQFDTKKSFHFDTSINFRELPYELKHILESIDASGHMSKEPSSYLPIRHRGNLYAICTKEAEKSVRGKQVKYTRLQTYYPIQEPNEINRISSNRIETKVNNNLSVFPKKGK